MELPSVVHPKKFKKDGFIFQVVSYCALSDEQARNAIYFYLKTSGNAW